MEQESELCQNDNPEEAVFDIEICQMSNTGFDETDADFLAQANEAARRRLAEGYNTDGTLGGPYTEDSPPPGKVCGGFLKGNIGVIWKETPPEIQRQELEDTSVYKPGYCTKCGYSLYHYAGQTCRAPGEPPHPEWRGSPPPSFSEVNR